jgi:hypothetical protein
VGEGSFGLPPYGPPEAWYSDELARLTRAFGSQLRPLGYHTAKIHWSKERPRFAAFEKNLPTLAAARRERLVLDRALFGD